jgi:hypothetical protein
MAVGVLRDGSPVIASGGDDTVRVRRLADGTLFADPLDLAEPAWASPFMATSSSPRSAGTSRSTSQPLHDPYEIASCSAASADRYDHRIMAGYPVQRRHPPVIMREAARRRMRDSGTLSGTSAEEEQMTGKIMPLRERDASTVQAAADAFLSSPRYANPNTRRGYTSVLDRLLAGLGADRPLAEVSGEELAGLLEQLWGQRAPATWNRNRGAVAAWLSWCAANADFRDR